MAKNEKTPSVCITENVRVETQRVRFLGIFEYWRRRSTQRMMDDLYIIIPETDMYKNVYLNGKRVKINN